MEAYILTILQQCQFGERIQNPGLIMSLELPKMTNMKQEKKEECIQILQKSSKMVQFLDIDLNQD